jgi:CDP-diacylglycerol---glycerol-3-phosphate 3-phosphatidyltransferase
VKRAETFTDVMRVTFARILDRMAGFLIGLGLSPNAITLTGLVGHVLAAVLAAFGQMTWAGVVIVLFAPLDALDGAMARLQGKTTRFGAFLDSVTDRYAEFLILGGILAFSLQQLGWLESLLVYLAAAGSFLVSYTRSRAESLNFSAKIGILSRLERYLVLVPALILNIPMVAVVIIAVLTQFTAIQRIVHVYRQSQQDI